MPPVVIAPLLWSSSLAHALATNATARTSSTQR
jgi:hypothetical protein